MNALAFLNNFEKEFTGPFLNRSLNRSLNKDWLGEYAKTNASDELSSSLKYDEKEMAWTLMVELAGVTKDHIKIDTTDGYLRLTGEKTKGVHTGNFEGYYNLPEDIDAEKIAATFEDGILSVHMPVAEKKLAKTIQIK